MLKSIDSPFSKGIFLSAFVLIVLSFSGGLLLNQPLLFLLAPAMVFAYWIIVDFKQIYWLVLISLPLCVELKVGSGFSTDMPTEPLMVLSMLVTVFYLLLDRNALGKGFSVHPIFLVLMLHLLWIFIAAMHSVDLLVSYKFFLAKSWYVLVFVLFSAILIKKEDDFKKAFWLLNIPLIATVIYVLIRHYQIDFSFGRVNNTMKPFYRNHVNYAVMLVVFLPYALGALRWYKPFTTKRLVVLFSIVVLVLGIFFSYTRAAQLSMLMIPVLYAILRSGAMKWLSVGALIFVVGFIVFMANGNRYMDFAHDYHKTRFHDEGFASHLEATIKGRDISSNERVYRWVAGLHMFNERPISGFGPGNFYPYYFGYTISAFATYVSENEERSTVHNYFLLTLIEQGVIGLLILILLVFIVLFEGQRILNNSPPKEKRYVSLLIVSFLLVLMNLFLSDLVETPKVGFFFFLPMALLINQDLKNKKEKRLEMEAQKSS